MEIKQGLKRTLGMKEAVTITVGNVIGVGLFTTGSQIVGDMGASVVLATFLAMVIQLGYMEKWELLCLLQEELISMPS